MEVGLTIFPKMEDQTTIQEAAAQGLKSIEHLIRTLSQQSNANNTQSPLVTEITDFTVSRFRKVICLLNRTGRARFRRAPVPPSSSTPSSPPQAQTVTTEAVPDPAPRSRGPTLDFSKPGLFGSGTKRVHELVDAKESFSVSSDNSSFMSSVITGDGSVSKGKQGSSMFLEAAAAPLPSSEKPPLSGAPYKKRCLKHKRSEDVFGKLSGSSNEKCRCSNNRKNRVTRTVRVPAISSKISDVPQDEHSWRKYGQKPIKGSPHPRGYYKCSRVRGCPARKHVERAMDNPTMLIVTYEGEHRHTADLVSGST